VKSEILTAVRMKMAIFYMTHGPRHIALKTEKASTSETSVNLDKTTRSNNPEGSHLNYSGTTTRRVNTVITYNRERGVALRYILMVRSYIFAVFQVVCLKQFCMFMHFFPDPNYKSMLF
jgi:hypothetical protein